MRQHQSRVRSEGAEHVRCAAIKEVVEAAPQGFAIDRHMTPTLDFGSIIQDGGMAAEHGLDRGRVKLTADRRVGWCFPPLHAERVAQLSKMNRFCQPVRQLLVIVGRDGYARALCEGMTGDALPRMPIDSRQGTT